MAEPLTSTSLDTLLQGGTAAQVDVGSYRLLIHAEHGAVVVPAPPGSSAPPPLTDTEEQGPVLESAADDVDDETARKRLAPLPDEEKRVLSALAAAGGGPLAAVHLAPLADVRDPRPALDALVERGLAAEVEGSRHRLTGNLARLLPSIWDLSPWCERALAYFLPWAEARREDPAALLGEADALRYLLKWTAATGRQAETVRLGRSLDAVLAVSRRWHAWGEALEGVRRAAEALRDRAAEAWAFHQLGTRLLCLGDRAGARQLLGQAVALRNSLGDSAGAEVSRHNLGLTGAPASAGGIIRIPPFSFRLLPWFAVALLLAIVIGIRFASSRMGEPLRQGQAEAAPVTGDEPTRARKAGVSPVSVEEETPELTSDLGAPPITSDLDADGGEGPLLEVPQSVEIPDFVLGSAPGSAGQTIAVTNPGTASLRVAGISFTENPGQAFTLRSNCTRRSIRPGERCLVQIFFHPPEPGTYNAVLAIDAEGAGRRTVEVSGTAKEAPREEPREPPVEPPPPAKEPPREPERPPVAPIPVLGWCCSGGETRQTTEADCKERQGGFYKGQRAATAACLIVGCCLDGAFKLGETRERCDEQGGTFMSALEVPLRCRAP